MFESSRQCSKIQLAGIGRLLDSPLLNGVASQLIFIAKCSELMKTFSERKGLKPVSEIIQIDSMNEALRNSLWNALDVALWSSEKFIYCD